MIFRYIQYAYLLIVIITYGRHTAKLRDWRDSVVARNCECRTWSSHKTLIYYGWPPLLQIAHRTELHLLTVEGTCRAQVLLTVGSNSWCYIPTVRPLPLCDIVRSLQHVIGFSSRFGTDNSWERSKNHYIFFKLTFSENIIMLLKKNHCVCLTEHETVKFLESNRTCVCNRNGKSIFTFRIHTIGK